MENGFIEFVTNIVKSVGLVVSDDYITTTTGKKVMMEGIETKIPTMDAVNSTSKIVDNQLVESHKIFNPFAEDEIKKNYHLTVLEKYMSSISSNGVMGVMSQLIELLEAEDGPMQDKLHTTIQKFIVSLRETIGNKGKLVNKRSRSSFDKLCSKLIEDGLFIVNYKSARGDKIAGVKYNRIARLDPKVLEMLENKELELNISDRDKEIFIAMIKFIIPDMANTAVGSKSSMYPSYMSIMELYNDTQGRINFLLTELKEVMDMSPLIMPVNSKLIDAEKYKKEINFLPSNTKLEKIEPAVAKAPVMQYNMDNYGTTPTNTMLIGNPVVEQQKPTITLNGNVSLAPASEDPLDILKSRNKIANTQHGFINNNNAQILPMGSYTQGTRQLTLAESLMYNNEKSSSLAQLMNNQGGGVGRPMNQMMQSTGPKLL